jgi:hypothetical protein
MQRPLPLVRTFTENMMAYAIGRRMEYYDNPTIRKIVREAEGTGRTRSPRSSWEWSRVMPSV